MHRYIALGLSALALASSAVVRAEDPAPAAQATEATTASAAQVAAAPASAAAKQQHCWKEYRVGSNMPVTHCESNEETEAQRQDRLRNVENSISHGNNTMRAPGGG